MTPRVLILRTAGTNCDRELAAGFRLAGGEPEVVHLNRVLAEPSMLDQADILALPGGFSYGDDIAAGRIFATRLTHDLRAPLERLVTRGVPILGICNGFQVLVKAGLLPDPSAWTQQVSLVDTRRGRFDTRWVDLEAPADSRCIWTRGLPPRFLMPAANAEGRFVAPPEVLAALEANGQVALRYAVGTAGAEGNGSDGNIAGICDASGRVFGLMPHPERDVRPGGAPGSARSGDTGTPIGLRVLRAAVEHVREARVSAPRAVGAAGT